MDGIHDLGGKAGFGPVEPEVDEPAFHDRWEARVFALMRAAGVAGAYRNADQFRHAIERIRPESYLCDGYYGRWLAGLETLLREAGILEEQELRSRIAALGGDPSDPGGARPAAEPGRVSYPPAAEGSRRAAPGPPAFAAGDRVRTASFGVPGHTRLPAYARGRSGTVATWHGAWVFPDSNAHGRGEQPQHLYTVVFEGADLWGEGAEPGTAVSLDLFEPYLTAWTGEESP